LNGQAAQSEAPVSHKALYAAFDLFPGAKGAATHISSMAKFLFEKYDGGLLLTLGSREFAAHEREGRVEIERFSALIPNYLERAEHFSQFVSERVAQLGDLEVAHYRDIWSALGILNPQRAYKTLFEVNGLPSIELPYRYPSLPASTLAKIREIETYCLAQSDHLIVPSEVIRGHLIGRGVEAEKIDVVTNAANVTPNYEPFPGLPEYYILYFGAVQPWQGVDTLLKAFALLRDIEGLRLVMCCAGKEKQARPYIKLAEKLDIADKIVWEFRVGKSQLNTIISQAQLSVAPLRECARNIEQGCSPLKIFESMACGTAVVASQLPVTEEILENNVSGKLVRPDRPQELSRAIRLLLEYPQRRQMIADAGRELIQNTYNWDQIKQQMFHLYERL